MESDSGVKIVCENRKARFNYDFIEQFEAGIVLTGAEIKSIRRGTVSIEESYVRPDGSDLILVGCHIRPYEYSQDKEYEPTRKRRLLLHRREINQLRAGIEKKGLTIVPVKLYLKRGYAKLDLALARGKSAPDKRLAIKEREGQREAARALKTRTR